MPTETPAITPPSTPRLLTFQQVLERTSLSRAEFYRRMDAGEMPRPFVRTANTLAWLESEISDWILSRPRAPKLRSPNHAPRRTPVDA